MRHILDIFRDFHTPTATIGVTKMLLQQADAIITGPGPGRSQAAPVAMTGDNIYVAWWTNKTAKNNDEVMFRASTDAGKTFGDKINLSNTTNADSNRVEMSGDAK